MSDVFGDHHDRVYDYDDGDDDDDDDDGGGGDDDKTLISSKIYQKM